MAKLEMGIHKRPSYNGDGWTHSATLVHHSHIGYVFPELRVFEGRIILLREVTTTHCRGSCIDNPGFTRDNWYFTIGNFINITPRPDTVATVDEYTDEDEEEE